MTKLCPDNALPSLNHVGENIESCRVEQRMCCGVLSKSLSGRAERNEVGGGFKSARWRYFCHFVFNVNPSQTIQ